MPVKKDRYLMHWIYVHEAIAQLAKSIKYGPNNCPRIDNIVAISRGGMIPAVMLSHALDVRTVYSIGVESYDDDGKQTLPVLKVKHAIGEWNYPTTLVIDDIIDTGKTFDMLQRYIPRANFCALVSKIHHRAHVGFQEVKGRWVVFPWEAPYTDEMRRITDEIGKPEPI